MQAVHLLRHLATLALCRSFQIIAAALVLGTMACDAEPVSVVSLGPLPGRSGLKSITIRRDVGPRVQIVRIIRPKGRSSIR